MAEARLSFSAISLLLGFPAAAVWVDSDEEFRPYYWYGTLVFALLLGLFGLMQDPHGPDLEFPRVGALITLGTPPILSAGMIRTFRGSRVRPLARWVTGVSAYALGYALCLLAVFVFLVI